MSALEKTLADIHPEARIVAVEVDEHEHRDTVCCEFTGERLVEEEQLLDGCGVAWVTVARILTQVPGEKPEHLESRTSSEWLPVSSAALRELLDLAREHAKSEPVTNENKSVRAARIARIDDQIDDIAFRRAV